MEVVVLQSTDFDDTSSKQQNSQKHKEVRVPGTSSDYNIQTMLFTQIARVTVQPIAQRQQRRTILNWMTNYPDRVS